jgi:hypothetical protein
MSKSVEELHTSHCTRHRLTTDHWDSNPEVLGVSVSPPDRRLRTLIDSTFLGSYSAVFTNYTMISTLPNKAGVLPLDDRDPF